jgi:hypothetical protein
LGSDSVNRRELLTRGGEVFLAGAVAALLPLDEIFPLGKLHDATVPIGSAPAPSADAGVLQKCISLGGPGAMRIEGHPDDYRLWGNREYFAESKTGWVKLWISWADLQGELDRAPANRARSWAQLNQAPGGQRWLERLDRQVKAANDDGVRVILTLFHDFPRWSSGATGRDPVTRTKPAEASLPTDLSPTGPWGWFIGHLCARYRRGAARSQTGPHPGARDGEGALGGNRYGAWIDALEICNEPNLLFWPQERAAGAVATMIRSAAKLSRSYGGQTILAPATSDYPDRSQENERGLVATDWRAFTADVLDRLRGLRPEVPVYWSHHNFRDVKLGEEPSRAERVIALLERKRWPTRRLWLTEGGFNLFPNQSDPRARARQAELIERSFSQMRDVPGVYMWTQHTISDKADNDFKGGLRDDFVDGVGPGAKRPSWFTWRQLEG